MLQLADFSVLIHNRNANFGQELFYNTVLSSSAWEYLSDKKEIIFLTSGLDSKQYDTSLVTSCYSQDIVFDIAYYANKYNMSLNDFYIGRRDVEKINANKIMNYSDIIEGRAERSKIYLFSFLPLEIMYEQSLEIYFIDGIYVGITEEIPSSYCDATCKKVNLNDVNSFFPIGNKYITNGKNENHVLTLDKDGVLYGPYINMPAGKYEISIIGSGLDRTSYDILIPEGKVPISTISRNDNLIKYTLDINEGLNDVEVRIFNMSDTSISINDIWIEKL